MKTSVGLQHTAYVEFEIEVGEPLPIPEEYREFDTRTHYQPTRKLRLTARESDVDTLLVKMLSHEDTHLSELSCAARCSACKSGYKSPF